MITTRQLEQARGSRCFRDRMPSWGFANRGGYGSGSSIQSSQPRRRLRKFPMPPPSTELRIAARAWPSKSSGISQRRCGCACRPRSPSVTNQMIEAMCKGLSERGSGWFDPIWVVPEWNSRSRSRHVLGCLRSIESRAIPLRKRSDFSHCLCELHPGIAKYRGTSNELDGPPYL